MTHAELTISAGVFASECPGELAHHGEFPDTVANAGVTETRTVTLYFCRGCGFVLSAAGGRVLNAYRPAPARIVAELARHMRGKMEGGPHGDAQG